MKKNIFWPEIYDLWSAKKACIQASSSAFVVAIITGAVTYFQMKGSTALSDIPSGSYLDCAIFISLGFFIYRCSRIACVAGLIIYAAGQIMTLPQMDRFPIMPIFLSLFFIGGIRGAFAYQEMKKGLSKEEIKVTLKEQREEMDPGPSLKKRVIAWIILVLLAVVGFWFYKKSSAHPASSGSHAVIEDVLPEPLAKKTLPVKSTPQRSIPPPAPAKPLPGERVFNMKDGRTITGRVTADDPIYYTVETSGGRQEIVIKEDIAR